MRLTCPNCSAKYEVDDAMVPPDGREVQCSNCSHTWFQPGRVVPEDTPQVDVTADVEPSAPPSFDNPDLEEPTPDIAASGPRVSEVDVEGPSGVPGAEVNAQERRPVRSQIDAGVADILRQEAEREARLRRASSAPLPAPQQEEMPLPEAEPPKRERRIAELENAKDAFDVDEIAATVAAATAASRREQFPDIEEINSTLRATGDRREEEANASDVDTLGSGRRRGGAFRRGFFTMIFIALILLLIYIFADRIAAAMPALGSALDSYVTAVEWLRFWLDGVARSMAGRSDG